MGYSSSVNICRTVVVSDASGVKRFCSFFLASVGWVHGGVCTVAAAQVGSGFGRVHDVVSDMLDAWEGTHSSHICYNR